MKLSEVKDKTDTVTLDVPLFIRMLEWAREDAKSDMDLHVAAENAVKLRQRLRMSDYATVIAGTGKKES